MDDVPQIIVAVPTPNSVVGEVCSPSLLGSLI
jgi:hypothetical protein